MLYVLGAESEAIADILIKAAPVSVDFIKGGKHRLLDRVYMMTVIRHLDVDWSIKNAARFQNLGNFLQLSLPEVQRETGSV